MIKRINPLLIVFLVLSNVVYCQDVRNTMLDKLVDGIIEIREPYISRDYSKYTDLIDSVTGEYTVIINYKSKQDSVKYAQDSRRKQKIILVDSLHFFTSSGDSPRIASKYELYTTGSGRATDSLNYFKLVAIRTEKSVLCFYIASSLFSGFRRLRLSIANDDVVIMKPGDTSRDY